MPVVILFDKPLVFWLGLVALLSFVIQIILGIVMMEDLIESMQEKFV